MNVVVSSTEGTETIVPDRLAIPARYHHPVLWQVAFEHLESPLTHTIILFLRDRYSHFYELFTGETNTEPRVIMLHHLGI